MILVLLLGMCCLTFWFSSLSLVPFPQWSEALILEQGQKWLAGGGDLSFYQGPMLPLLISVLNKIGFGGVHGLRLLGVIGFFAFVYRMMNWMRSHRVFQNAPVWIWLVSSALIFSTGFRGNFTLIRPEIWLAYLWLSILMEIEKPSLAEAKASHWRLARYLATAMYFRIDSILWVLPIFAGILPHGLVREVAERRVRQGEFIRKTLRRMFSLSWKTGLFLAPLFFSLGFHYVFRAFYSAISLPQSLEKLRLSGEAISGSVNQPFFALFLDALGTTAGSGDGRILYFVKLGLFVLTISAVLGTVVSIIRHFEKNLGELGSRITALLGIFLAFLALKANPTPENSAFFQYLLWPLIVMFISDWIVISPWTGSMTIRVLQPLYIVIFLSLFLLQFILTFSLWTRTNDSGVVNWDEYRHWVDCIETEAGRHANWVQRGVLDASMEVLGRNPHRKIFLVDPSLSAVKMREITEPLAQSTSIVWIRTRYIPETGVTALTPTRGKVCRSGPFRALLTDRFEDFIQDSPF